MKPIKQYDIKTLETFCINSENAQSVLETTYKNLLEDKNQNGTDFLFLVVDGLIDTLADMDEYAREQIAKLKPRV